MRVLFFNYEYPPLGGGAANATAYILREYSKIPDLEVDLVTSSVDNKYHLEKIGGNVDIHRLPIGKNPGNLHFQSQRDLLAYSWKAFLFSRKLILKNRYDMTHSFFSVPCGFLSLAYYWWYKLPYVVSLRGADVPGYSDRFNLMYIFLKPLIKHIWKKSDFTVANSQGLKELSLRSKPNKEIKVIYNGIDTEQFYPDYVKRSGSEFIITSGASRVTHRKGLNYLIEAVAELLPHYPRLRLKIIGEGNTKKELENLVKKSKIEKNVDFVGRIPHEKTPAYYQEANLFVLPSINEGMSNAILEALASGLPILATDTGGSKELVRDGINGFIIRMKDAADIAEKIKKIIANAELRASMSQASRQLAETMSWSKVAHQYFTLYKKIKSKIC